MKPLLEAARVSGSLHSPGCDSLASGEICMKMTDGKKWGLLISSSNIQCYADTGLLRRFQPKAQARRRRRPRSQTVKEKRHLVERGASRRWGTERGRTDWGDSRFDVRPLNVGLSFNDITLTLATQCHEYKWFSQINAIFKKKIEVKNLLESAYTMWIQHKGEIN